MVVLSNKENWIVYPEEIAKRLGVSRDMVDRHFKKIEKAGYLRTFKKSLGRGKGVQVFRFSQMLKLPIFNLKLCYRD